MKISDSKIYLCFSIVMLLVAVLFGLPGIYSRIVTEPAIERLMAQSSDSSKLQQAYIMLRKPHIFAGYDRFDEGGAVIEYVLKEFDVRIAEQRPFNENDVMYLDLLLTRRKQGSDLSIKTMVFFMLLSILGVVALIIERLRQ